VKLFLRLFLLGFNVIVLGLIAPTLASAHEVRPAFLKLEQTAPLRFNAIWKQPVLEGKRLKITPKFPDDCKKSPAQSQISDGTIRENFTVTCALSHGFLTFEGLEHTLTDIFVEITFLASGSQNQAIQDRRAPLTALIKPSQARLDLSRPTPPALGPYIVLGVEHILFGWDHLLFVICLTLMVSRRQIWGVATAFTVAHSLTLVLAALDLISVPTRPVEILIAASIVLMAVEIMRKFKGQSTLALRRPYLLAFFIGLIHGCGFASALSHIGLPSGTELLALLLFNIGVELGQFAVILGLLALFWMLGRWAYRSLRPLEYGLVYFSATIAVFWVIDRSKEYFI